MKKPIGPQFSFSNLDGARVSTSSVDRLSISFERQESVEDGEEEETKEEKEEEEEEKKNEKVLQLWSPKKLQRDYITSDPSATCGPSGKVTAHEGHININDAEFDPDLEVTEFDQVNTHPRPLQRARSRYKERTGNSPWENRHSSDCPPHVPAVESGKHPGEACLESDEVPADDDLAKFIRNLAV